MEAVITIFGVLALLTLVLIYSPLVWGLIVLKFWSWFILPIFPELPILEYWQAVGLYFFISLFRTHTADSIKKEYKKEATSTLTTTLLMPWMWLFIGYLFMLIIN